MPRPATMRAVVIEDFDRAPTVRELPVPKPAGGEVVVRVHATSVNGFELAVAAGLLRARARYRFPVTLRRDFAGVVESVGSDGSGFDAGDEVFGFLADITDLHEG